MPEWLIQADRKPTVTQITTFYNQGMHKSIFESTAEEQKTTG